MLSNAKNPSKPPALVLRINRIGVRDLTPTAENESLPDPMLNRSRWKPLQQRNFPATWRCGTYTVAVMARRSAQVDGVHGIPVSRPRVTRTELAEVIQDAWLSRAAGGSDA
ncbi:hypothetical protein MTER_37200 [Mycolicibacter terrae]|uniref:Uncharacterized protein n=1 Tax=Mycolicibacter terrae TaxID=1788 RepID=A0AAD1HZN8_9MYCO|nr:hypothetical protein MTER_37200 [Mycolicibacter terrae]